MTITTTEAIALREKLEADIMRLLVEYQRATELRVQGLGVHTVTSRTYSGAIAHHIITGVTVTVEV